MNPGFQPSSDEPTVPSDEYLARQDAEKAEELKECTVCGFKNPVGGLHETTVEIYRRGAFEKEDHRMCEVCYRTQAGVWGTHPEAYGHKEANYMKVISFGINHATRLADERLNQLAQEFVEATELLRQANEAIQKLVRPGGTL